VGLHKNYNISLETTIELYPDLECPILVEATASTFTDTHAEDDADGNRGHEATEFTDVMLHTIRIYLVDRPTIFAAQDWEEVKHFLTDDEYDSLLEQVCVKVFEGKAEET